MLQSQHDDGLERPMQAAGNSQPVSTNLTNHTYTYRRLGNCYCGLSLCIMQFMFPECPATAIQGRCDIVGR